MVGVLWPEAVERINSGSRVLFFSGSETTSSSLCLGAPLLLSRVVLCPLRAVVFLPVFDPFTFSTGPSSFYVFWPSWANCNGNSSGTASPAGPSPILHWLLETRAVWTERPQQMSNVKPDKSWNHWNFGRKMWIGEVFVIISEIVAGDPFKLRTSGFLM